MVNTLRRFSQPIMLFIAVGVIVSFAFFGPGGCNDQRTGSGRNALFEVHGKKITMEEQERLKNRLEVYGAMGSGYYESLATGERGNPYMPQPEDDADFSFVNSLIFEHEADAMGVGATDAEIAEELSKVPAFQREGKFDYAAFEMFVQQVMQPRGFSKENIDTFLRGSVRMRKVQELLKSTAYVTPNEVRESLIERHQITEASFVALKKADFLGAAVVSDEELKKRYDEQKDQLKTDEFRKVRYAAFLVPPADPEKPLSDIERTKLLQNCVNAAYDFSQAILKKGKKFDDAVIDEKKKADVPDKTKLAYGFTEGVSETFSRSTPPDLLEGIDDVAEAAFSLKADAPVSQHIIGKKGAYVVMLPADGITAPRQKTFDETKIELTAQLKSEKADAALRAKGEEIQKKIAEAKKSGKSFTEACDAAGVKSEALPGYSQMKPPQGPNASTVRMAAAKLAPGEISEFVASGDGGLIVHVDQRPVVDEKSFEAEKAATLMANERFRASSAFREWLKERRRGAGLGLPKADEKKS
jgi:peptidyl-prolyl cis-trans isomerase D